MTMHEVKRENYSRPGDSSPSTSLARRTPPSLKSTLPLVPPTTPTSTTTSSLISPDLQFKLRNYLDKHSPNWNKGVKRSRESNSDDDDKPVSNSSEFASDIFYLTPFNAGVQENRRKMNFEVTNLPILYFSEICSEIYLFIYLYLYLCSVPETWQLLEDQLLWKIEKTETLLTLLMHLTFFEF